MTRKRARNVDHPSKVSHEPVARDGQYLLRLYVTGASERASRAIFNLKNLCERHLSGRYKLEVVDIYQQPGLAKAEQIIAAPTLVKYLPLPLRRFIGDMSRTENILAGLDVQPVTDEDHEKQESHSPGEKPRF
jgi:circadian clock protein KaiB